VGRWLGNTNATKGAHTASHVSKTINMTKSDRANRVGILCCHFIRNLAFYDAGWRDGRFIKSDQFWKTLNGNFLDISTLEWCKLFGENKGQHHWSKVIESPDFLKTMLADLEVNLTQLDDCIKEMRTYRDRFVAHLDNDEEMQIPKFEIPYKSTVYLYDTLRSQQYACTNFKVSSHSGAEVYDYYLEIAQKAYSLS
jgi:hypothetical protein